MSHKGSKIRGNVNNKQYFRVCKVVIRLSALAEAFVSQSAKQFWSGM